VRYRLPRTGIRSIKEFALLSLRRRVVFDDFWALKQVDLSVLSGERLGVVGRNGAGKSTLMQVIARVVAPTAGAVAVHGRVAPLLQLGAGFDAELTGRENVYLNGSLLGMPHTEIAARFEAIVDFAELRDFVPEHPHDHPIDVGAERPADVGDRLPPAQPDFGRTEEPRLPAKLGYGQLEREPSPQGWLLEQQDEGLAEQRRRAEAGLPFGFEPGGGVDQVEQLCGRQVGDAEQVSLHGPLLRVMSRLRSGRANKNEAGGQPAPSGGCGWAERSGAGGARPGPADPVQQIAPRPGAGARLRA